MRTVHGSIAIALAFALAAVATAQTPVDTAFTYQGQLQTGGNPANGNYDFIFDLYASVIAVPTLGTVNANNVAVTNGLFTVQLDFGAAFDGNAKFLGIRVRPTGGAIYTVLSPRQELTAAPYAMGVRLPLRESVTAGTTAFSITNNNRVIEGVLTAPASGVTLPGFPITVLGTTSTGNGVVGASSADFAWAVAGLAGGDNSTAVRALHTGIGGYAGYFSSSNSSNTGNTVNIAADGTAASNALNASHTGLGDCGVFTISNAGNAAVAVTGTTNGTGRAGRFSNTNSANGSSAVYVTTNGDSGDGVESVASGAFSNGIRGQGLSSGVRGDCSTSNGSGVYGVNNSTTGTGVRGDSAGSGGAGVAGYDNLGTGVYGQSTGGGYGVYGTNGGSNSTGYAGYFNGRVQVAGTLSKGGGSFKIDHPLDPENKYLYHSFVESPDMMNIYNGVIVLNDAGEATVALPNWFEALNRDYRYQLTCIGGYAPVFIADEVKNGQFRIAGGKPGLKVSWQVTGIRQDPFANANRIPVEEAKNGVERGHLLYPEAYGRPQSDSVAEADRRARAAADEPTTARP